VPPALAPVSEATTTASSRPSHTRLDAAIGGAADDDSVAPQHVQALDITVQENTLLMTGKAQKEDENGGGYLHRGIARRAFERRFSLADHMKVAGASLNNGMLSVDVVPEVLETAKPRTIKIGTMVATVQPQGMEQKAV
jgi:molecular chaperone IbpA